MKKLEVGNWHQRPYGERADGVATVGTHAVRVTVRRPSHHSEAGQHIVMANGWTTSKSSMRQAAVEAARHGHTSYTFDYTNTHRRHALDHNATDLTTVIEALPKASHLRLLGLSMGGAVATVALDRLGNTVEQADLVAPGRYLLPEYYSPREVIRHVVSHSTESIAHRGRLRDDVRLLRASLGNCAHRPFAVLGEFLELVDGNVHEELRRVKSQTDAPVVNFRYGLRDKLLPAHAQLASIEGLPFDAVISYDEGHDWLARSPALAHKIFDLQPQELVA